MSRIGLIIQREYFTRVKKKSFILMTFLGPLLFAGIMVAAIWATTVDDTSNHVLVVDYTGLVSTEDESSGKLISAFPRRFKSSDKLTYAFSKVKPSDEEFKEGPYTLMIEFDDSILDETRSGHLYYKKVPSVQVTSRITGEIESALEEFKVLDDTNISYEEYKRLKVSVSWIKKDIESGDKESLEQEQAAVGMFFSVVIFFFIFLHGAQVMRGVIEEKTNRIVEVIVSSVKPFQLMLGKIFGIGLVGLTQFFMWIVLTFVMFAIGEAIFNAGYLNPTALADAQELANSAGQQQDFYAALAENELFNILFRINWPMMIVLFIFYFIGGYLLYAALFAAIGSAVDNETDTQQFMVPVMMPLFFAYFIAIMSVNNPEGVAATLFSIVPFTSPPVMMVRAAMGFSSETVWQLILSMALLIITFILVTWIAARIYRTGILMYGKKPSWKEIGKWLFYKG